MTGKGRIRLNEDYRLVAHQAKDNNSIVISTASLLGDVSPQGWWRATNYSGVDNNALVFVMCLLKYGIIAHVKYATL